MGSGGRRAGGGRADGQKNAQAGPVWSVVFVMGLSVSADSGGRIQAARYHPSASAGCSTADHLAGRRHDQRGTAPGVEARRNDICRRDLSGWAIGDADLSRCSPSARRAWQACTVAPQHVAWAGVLTASEPPSGGSGHRDSLQPYTRAGDILMLRLPSPMPVAVSPVTGSILLKPGMTCSYSASRGRTRESMNSQPRLGSKRRRRTAGPSVLNSAATLSRARRHRPPTADTCIRSRSPTSPILPPTTSGRRMLAEANAKEQV